MARPKIRHLAIMSRDTEKLAQWYKDVFQMEELNRSKGERGKIPAIYLTDGYLNLAILPCTLQGESPAGFNHFGWKIDDISEMTTVLVDHGVEDPKMRPANRPYAEFRGCDPDGNMFDLSVHGFDQAETRADREAQKPGVRSKEPVPAE
jgi:catechol 2,3-dioxygenase-like lactoylglutathione lyase family enzyme